MEENKGQEQPISSFGDIETARRLGKFIIPYTGSEGGAIEDYPMDKREVSKFMESIIP